MLDVYSTQILIHGIHCNTTRILIHHNTIQILGSLGVLDDDAQPGQRMEGRVVTIINRSDVVGRPLAAVMFVCKEMCVCVCVCV